MPPEREQLGVRKPLWLKASIQGLPGWNWGRGNHSWDTCPSLTHNIPDKPFLRAVCETVPCLIQAPAHPAGG